MRAGKFFLWQILEEERIVIGNTTFDYFRLLSELLRNLSDLAIKWIGKKKPCQNLTGTKQKTNTMNKHLSLEGWVVKSPPKMDSGAWIKNKNYEQTLTLTLTGLSREFSYSIHCLSVFALRFLFCKRHAKTAWTYNIFKNILSKYQNDVILTDSFDFFMKKNCFFMFHSVFCWINIFFLLIKMLVWCIFYLFWSKKI